MKRLILASLAVSISVSAFSSDLIPPSPFEKSKVIVNEPSSMRTMTTQSDHTVTEDLAVLMDMNCAEEKGLRSLHKYSEFAVVDSSPQIKMKRKVLKLQKKKQYTQARLQEFAEASECIIGISNEVKYKVNGFNDPRFSEQTQHSLLKTNDFYNKASWFPIADEDKAVIAVIDTGVDYSHSDLRHVIYRKNGAMVGASFVPGNPDYHDDHGHGTHVAGLAASEGNNFIGGTGVCGLSCYVMPIKVLAKDGTGNLSDIANGVFWAVDQGADVLNMSLGRWLNLAGMAPLELEAFRYAMLKNVTVLVAAGNDGAILDPNGRQTWPAMFGELPGVITVASLDAETGAFSTFSNRSSKYVEIGAPGSSSSTNGVYVGLLSTATGGGYVKMSGTSMATPVAAGAAGLIISYLKKHNVPYTIWDVEAFLKRATTSNPNFNKWIEGGRVLNLSLLADQLQETHEDPYRLDLNDPYEKFVNDLYYVILRRNYDVGGAQFNLSLMKERRLPFEQMIWNIFSSKEYKDNFGDFTKLEKMDYTFLKDHIIPSTFITILGRLPKDTESDFWLTYLSVYRTKFRFFIRSLLKTKEFNDRVTDTVLEDYPRMEKLPGDEHSFCNSYTFSGDYTYEKQVDYAYCVALERTPDAGGRAFYLGLLRNGYKLEDLVFEFFRSNEFHTLNEIDKLDDRLYVNILYYTILQRLPLPHEAFYWMEVLKRAPKEVVLRAMIDSEEFKSVLAKKSIRK